ncbi:MAG TPA: hypothetical protein VGM23_08760 [Armatimonadota bacterium]
MSPQRIVLALLGLLLLFVLVGCRKLPTFFREPQPTPASRTTTPAPSSVNLSDQAMQTVTDYVAALNEHNYARAYDMLSKESQSRHTRASFEQQGKEGMPSYDLKSAKTTVNGEKATVEMQISEEAGSHGFQLAREGEAWKIVYQGGRPGQPYGE